MADEEKLNSYEEKQAAEQKAMELSENDTCEWLKTDSKVQAYLSQFKEKDVESFITQYPKMKASFIHYGKTLGDLPEQHQLGYLSEAQDRLMDIQRKKIFDLMCRWDAEEVKFSEIQCLDDFDDWISDPDSCPYIPPVTKDEFTLYLMFVDTYLFEMKPEYMLFSYDDYRDGEDAVEEIPEWFLFENQHTGNDKYLNLPMIRSGKEDKYRKLYFEERQKQVEQKYETGEWKRHVPDTRKELSCSYYSHMEQFIIHNESKEVLDLFRKMYAYFPERLIRDNEEDNAEGWITEQVDRIMHEMSGIKEKIPIEANSDWRLGLIEAFQKYEKRQIVEGLRYAYSEYCLRKDLNLSSQANNKIDFDRSDISRKQILRGRVLNGEPENFDF